MYGCYLGVCWEVRLPLQWEHVVVGSVSVMRVDRLSSSPLPLGRGGPGPLGPGRRTRARNKQMPPGRRGVGLGQGQQSGAAQPRAGEGQSEAPVKSDELGDEVARLRKEAQTLQDIEGAHGVGGPEAGPHQGAAEAHG